MGSALLLFIDISFLVKFSVFSTNLQSILIIILRVFSDDSKICFTFGTVSVIHSPPPFFLGCMSGFLASLVIFIAQQVIEALNGVTFSREDLVFFWKAVTFHLDPWRLVCPGS